MIVIQFDERDLADLDEACDNPDLPEKLRRKFLCLKMHHQKVTNLSIAKVLRITPNTVISYIKDFRGPGSRAFSKTAPTAPRAASPPF